jgi:CRP/FNR family transcriptional regulator
LNTVTDKITENYNILKEILPFWNKLTNEQKNSLAENTAFAKYAKKSNIVSDTCIGTGAIYVKSGMLRAYLLSEEGREVTLYRMTSGDFCVLSSACASDDMPFDIFFDAETDAEIYIIGSQSYSRVRSENVYADNFSLKVAMSRFAEVIWALEQILFMSFDKRLAIFLIDELAHRGGDTVYMTHDQIAKHMGSAREVVTRMLKYFSSEGLVKLSRGGVTVINKDRLRRLTY